MIKMAQLTRSPRKIDKILVEQDDASVYTTKACSVFLPKRWLNTPLFRIEERVFAVAILMIKIGNDYAIYNIAGVLELGFAEYQTTLIDGVECIELSYQAGEIVFKDMHVAVDNTLPYSITEIVAKKGSIIPYLSYDDFLKIPLTFPEYSSLTIPELPFALIYMAYVCRDPKDKRKRVDVTRGGDYINIPLANISLSVDNTLNKFSGGYLDEGIQSAAMYPSERASMSEVVMRS